MNARAWLAASLLSGCALLGKSDPLEFRYYEVRSAAATQAAPSAGDEQTSRLRLGNIRAARYLDERLVSRKSASEIVYQEEQRWTEPPIDYVRRALEKSLYERAGFTRVLSGPATTLEVELTAFERIEAQDSARVELSVVLHDDRVQLAQRAIRVEVPMRGAAQGGEALAAALGQALDDAAGQVVQLTAQVLAQRAAAKVEQAAQAEALTADAGVP